MNDSELQRYRKQILVKQFGVSGQETIQKARVLIAGCGALGSVTATLLARAGIGYLRLADRDTVDISNLHRQILFSEKDAAEKEPKAEVSAEKLAAFNSLTRAEAVVTHIGPETIDALTEDTDLILDCTDNFETRFVINEAAVRKGIPWIYTGVTGTEGMVKSFVPVSAGSGNPPLFTECLQCYIPEIPDPEKTENCDTAGILGTTVMFAASLQVNEAIKILTGRYPELLSGFVSLNIWSGSVKTLKLPKRRSTCPVCGVQQAKPDVPKRSQDSLRIHSFCGKDTWQITGVTAFGIHENIHSYLYNEVVSRSGISESGFIPWKNFLWKQGRSSLKVIRESTQILIFHDGRFLIENAGSETQALDVFYEIIRIFTE